MATSATALLTAAASPAFAQKMVEEVTIEGRIPRPAAQPVTYRVGHADLDLRTAAAIEELSRRIRVASNYVCEQANAGLDVHTCQTKTIMDVQDDVHAAIRDQPSPFTPGPSWTPPPGRK